MLQDVSSVGNGAVEAGNAASAASAAATAASDVDIGPTFQQNAQVEDGEMELLRARETAGVGGSSAGGVSGGGEEEDKADGGDGVGFNEVEAIRKLLSACLLYSYGLHSVISVIIPCGLTLLFGQPLRFVCFNRFNGTAEYLREMILALLKPVSEILVTGIESWSSETKCVVNFMTSILPTLHFSNNSLKYKFFGYCRIQL